MWPFRRRVPTTQHSLLDGDYAVEGQLLRMWSDAGAVASSTQFDIIAKSGYRACAVVRACVDEIVTSIAEPKLLVERWRPGNQWEEVEPSSSGPRTGGHQLLALLANPGGDRKTSSSALRRQIVQQDQIFGNSFLRKRRNASGAPAALEVLPVPYVEPVRPRGQSRAKVVKIEYTLTDSQAIVAGDSVTLSLDDVIHRKEIDPLESFWGLPKIVSALKEIDLDQRAVDYLRTYFKNGGTPSGVLKLKGQIAAPERKRIKMQWLEEFSGKKRHSLAVIDQDAEYEAVGTRPDHLKLGESVFDISESRACAVFGVPPVLIGVRIGIMKSTYSNYASARTSFWNETLRPMYQFLDEDLTLQLAHEFGEPGEYRIRHDLSNVRDLQESTEILWTRAKEGYDSGLITRNEARKIVALPKDEGGEHYKSKTADGKPSKPEAMPLPVPAPPKPALGAGAGPKKPAAKKPAAKNDNPLQLVEKL